MIKKTAKRKQQEAEGKHGDARYYYDRETQNIKYGAFFYFVKDQWYVCEVGSGKTKIYLKDDEFKARFIPVEEVTFDIDAWEAAAKQGKDDE